MKRRPFPSMWQAVELFGRDKCYHDKPSYVPDGCCPNCGKKVENKRRTFCCDQCRIEYGNAVYWQRGRGTYTTHILYRDNFTCQKCGTFHAWQNKYGIYLPTSDGNLDVHHKQYVCDGGDDSPDNLETLCRECHKEIHFGEG